MDVFGLIGTGVLLVIILVNKIRFRNIRNGSKKIEAEVLYYEREKGPFRNDSTKLWYPYVSINSVNKETAIHKLHYAYSSHKAFRIGQKITVFWYEGKLMYWGAQ